MKFLQIGTSNLSRVVFAATLLLILALPMAVSADVVIIEDQASCESAGGSFSALDICVIDALSIPGEDMLVVSDSAYVQLTGQSSVDGELRNEGIVDLIGRLTVNDNGRLDNVTLFNIRPSGYIDNHGRVDNTGRLSNGGTINNLDGIFDNACEGVIFGSGDYVGDDPLNTPGTLSCTSRAAFLPYLSG
jgi:hypothetical protein